MKNKMIAMPDPDDWIKRFRGLVLQGCECWRKAGELLLEAEEVIPKFRERLLGANPWLDAELLQRFRDFAQKNADPMLWVSTRPGYLRARTCAYDTQVKLLAECVPVVVERPDNLTAKFITELVSLDRITELQAQQCFATGKLRTFDEQVMWLRKRRAVAARAKFTRTPDGILPHKNELITWAEMEEALKQRKSGAA